MKPIIGITSDFEESGEFKTRLEGEGRYILREGYSRAIADNGGLPVILPYDAAPESIIARVHGLVVTGGNFDIPPELSKIRNPSLARKIRPARTAHEMALIKQALELDMPLLSICGGMQLLAVVMGGSMIGDIVTELPGAIDHEKDGKRDEPTHNILIEKNTLLYRVMGTTEIGVNSSHHQAVADPGRAMASARATDDVIEAIELEDKRFVLGVEWHPELLYKKYAPHRAIFERLMEEAARTKAR